ncbi:hypothetical protein CFC21_007224 [Triticum aestivum]|uniref:Bowman-Birk serine protease inhibitors family domain-containing protein n=2 Tax=Triticum aestivum TaxID=4565 RepID=A0A3B6LW35_WHEAT|nr:uncharacterized protein LOC119312428 [Triticum dicoccoides]XP_044391159.1 uncharacterized protein LOC123113904 [Triticum aestivum]KAF6989960.1 hypothetical protein CFC21_007224 [Triticum aestivum]
MKSSTLVAILVLQAVMVMGILAHSQAADTDDDFPKCCDHCNSWSGAQFCDDVGPKCRDGCVNCRVVQTRPVKTFRCGDGRSAYPYIPARRRAKRTDRSTSSHSEIDVGPESSSTYKIKKAPMRCAEPLWLYMHVCRLRPATTVVVLSTLRDTTYS